MYNSFITKKNILIIGGIGSLSHELVREVRKHHPKVVRVFDVDETEQFEFHHDLKEYEGTIHFLLGDVRDRDSMIRAAEDVDIIFHTAVLKHVMACEYNPLIISNLSNIGL